MFLAIEVEEYCCWSYQSPIHFGDVSQTVTNDAFTLSDVYPLDCKWFEYASQTDCYVHTCT